jgi:hypothetical protein
MEGEGKLSGLNEGQKTICGGVAAVNESFREAIEVIVKVCTLDCG